MPTSANDPSLSRAARLLKLLEQDNSDLTGRSQPGARPFLSALQPLPLVARNRLRKVCDRWDFWYHGKELPGKDCRGMHLLNILLHSPHEDFHVLNLMQLVTRGKAVGDLTLHGNLPAQLLAQEGLVISYDCAAIAGLDARARAEYQNRLRDLEGEITEAEVHHDLGRLERLQIEKQALLQELMSNSYRGHRRQESPIVRNARTNIRKHLRKVREKIRREAPDLGEHLEEYLSTGTYCSYRPPLDIPPWE